MYQAGSYAVGTLVRPVRDADFVVTLPTTAIGKSAMRLEKQRRASVSSLAAELRQLLGIHESTLRHLQHVRIEATADGQHWVLDIAPAGWHFPQAPKPTKQLIDDSTGVRGPYASAAGKPPPVAGAFNRRPWRPTIPAPQLLARAHKRFRRRLAAIDAAYRALGRARRFAAAEFVLACRLRRQFRTALVGTLTRNAPPAAV